MSELFLKIVNMSISASWLVLAVLGFRLVLKKSPKWVNVLLWGIVAIRLILPFSLESALSMIPSAETIPEAVLSGSSFDIQTGITPVDDQLNDYLEDSYFEGVTVPASNGFNVMTVLSIVWLVGVFLLAAYTAVSYLRLRRRINTAVLLRENIYQSESVISPFVLGVIRPRIYLPFKLDAQSLEYVVAHEMAHIRRKDHWWKPLGFLLLTIHWFNPLLWIAYVLLCRDIEIACDEKVIKKLDNDGRADYTQALVSCSMNRRLIAACPLAFGEVGVKERVKSVMNYRKPAFWSIVLSVIVCGILMVCFLTDPVEAESADDPDISYEETTLPSFNLDDISSNSQEEEIARMEADRLKLEAELEALKAEVEALKNEKEILEAGSRPQDVTTQIAMLLDTILEGNRAELTELCSYGEETLYYCFSAILSGEQLGEYGPVMTAVCHEIAIQWGDELLMVTTSDADDMQWVNEFDLKAESLYKKYGDEKFAQMYPAACIYLHMKNT